MSESPDDAIPLHYADCPYTGDDTACTCGPEHLASVWKARCMVLRLENKRLHAQLTEALAAASEWREKYLEAQRAFAATNGECR